jgi:hypothetical protein
MSSFFTIADKMTTTIGARLKIVNSHIMMTYMIFIDHSTTTLPTETAHASVDNVDNMK